MLTSTLRITHSLLRRRTLTLVLVLLLLSFCTATVEGQNPVQPKRGFYPAGSYALSDVETINTTTGNIIFRLPIASLPAGRGNSAGASVGLFYNSKIWDTFSYTEWVGDIQVPVTDLKVSDSGGWRYGFKFDLQLVNRFQENSIDIQSCDQLEAHFVHKLRMKFPDGSEHVFRPRGQNDVLNDDYFRYRPDGWSTFCLQDQPDFTGTMVYYSADGTYMRLEILHDSDANWANNPWTLYLPDGRRITGGNAPQRIYDRNNNYVEIQNITYNGHPATKIVDQLGRYIIVEYGPAVGPSPEIGRDFVHAWRMENGQLTQVTWTIKWRNVDVNKGYYRNNLGESMGLRITPSVVGLDELVFPAQSGGLSYRFTYNPDLPAPERGWGEVSTMTIPSGAQVKYKFVFDGVGAPTNGITSEQIILLNQPTRKDLTYQLEYDGTSTPTTETWQYEFLTTESQITAPDGGITREYFFDITMGSMWQRGLSYKTVKPDGSTVERIWQQNIPYDYGNDFHPRVNSFLKTEFNSIKNAAGSFVSTAIKDYTYDKNGNLLQEAEYDWVSYGSVQRNQGNPTGAIPAGAQVKRVTVNDYYNPTPSAPSTTFSPNIYTQATAPNFRQALQSSEIRSGLAATSAQSRKEIIYDNPSTTGNTIEQKTWDSTEGALTRPLNTSNSISIFNQYDLFGNVTLTTDARGHQTQNIYGPVNGFSDLYATETKVGLGTTVQRRTTMEYDFHSGLVTRTTDLDNNVSTANTYDVFLRPILVRSVEGTPEETRTVTEYSDVNRRVIVKSDLSTTGDGKLVSIQHHDQMGRVRLSRKLEDAANQSATDEAVGIKVQTRFMYSGTFSFELTSNSYRAATSTLASSEATMGWSRSKTDNAGRVVEVQTFTGTSLPAPWGSNASSTGTVATSYDANFTTVTDPAQNVRKSGVDGLGRLKEVYEDPGNLNHLTSYGYDALGNLVTLTQGQQTRSFGYSSRSLLISATNPEMCNQQGQQCTPVPVTYSYDENGNLKTKTDARLITTSFQYDALNRVTLKTYQNDPTNTPSVHYYYDSQGLPTGAPTFDRGLAAGRLVAVLYGGSQSIIGNYQGYDASGQVKRSIQVTNDGQANQIYTFPDYDYDLAGNLRSQTYPSGRTIVSDYDPAGRLAGLRNGATGPFYAGGASTDTANRIQYSAAGAISQMRLGNQLWEHTNFNSRQQPIQIGLGTTSTSSSTLQLDYEYGTTNNNGNLRGHTITIPGLTLSQSYDYDKLNRLEIVNENGGASWKQKFVYDRYGNRRIDTSPANTSPDLIGPNPVLSEANNRIVPQAGEQYQYDKAGNLTTGVTGLNYVYDAENRMISFNGGASQGGASYSYDGNGKRIKKAVGTSITLFVYDVMERLVAEYSSDPPSTNGTRYLTSDYLGTPRVMTDSLGAMKARHDYHPFGEEVGWKGGRSDQNGYVSDTVRQKFSSKERDSETGLDYFGARYYFSLHGRFTSVDPIKLTIERLSDPQRLNLYEYCRNDPLKFLDPDGEDLVLANAAARARARQVINPGLTRAERRNIRIARGRVELRNPQAINTQTASPAYRYLSEIITNQNLTIEYYAVGRGQTVTTSDGLTASYQDVVNSGGLTTGSDGDALRSVIVPIGGANPVAGQPAGSTNTVPNPEDVIFAHEAYGHGLGNDAVQVENEYRRTRNPPLAERSGTDHQHSVTVTSSPELIQTTPVQLITEIQPKPLIPVPQPTPPPRRPEQ